MTFEGFTSLFNLGKHMGTVDRLMDHVAFPSLHA